MIVIYLKHKIKAVNKRGKMAEEVRQYLFKNTTFTYKGEKYHYIDGKIVDSTFLSLSSDIENDVNHFVYGQVNYKALNTQKNNRLHSRNKVKPCLWLICKCNQLSFDRAKYSRDWPAKNFAYTH